jgi:hypothetical protein
MQYLLLPNLVKLVALYEQNYGETYICCMKYPVPLLVSLLERATIKAHKVILDENGNSFRHVVGNRAINAVLFCR